MGWLKANPGVFNAPLQKAVKWVGQQRGGYGGFGSTQSTILALKALIAYTNANKRTAEGGELRLYVGDKQAAELSFKAGTTEALTLELKDAEKVLHPGRNDVRVEITGKNTFPYTLAWTYQTLKPISPEGCPVRLETKLSRTEVQEGDLVRLNMTLENVSGKGQGMAVAVLGLPGGLTVPEDMKQLKQYTRLPEDGSRPLVSAFEVRGRELVLVLARPGAGPDDPRAAGPDRPRARRVQRPRQPRLPVLQRRPQGLGRSAAGDDQGQARVIKGYFDTSNKEAVIETVRELPDDVSLEDILERIAILAAIRRGEEAADAGRVIPHEEVKTRVASWITK